MVLLRDVECQEPAAICAALGITEANMRVLLHRARTRLRDAAAALVEPAAAGTLRAGQAAVTERARPDTWKTARPLRAGAREGWMPTCQEVAEQATEYLDRAMPRRQRLGVWAHLRFCPNCRAYLRQLLRTIALARRAGAAAARAAAPRTRTGWWR